MKKFLTIIGVLCIGMSILLGNKGYDNPPLQGNFYLDADSDSDIDPGAEDWTNGYFESRHVDKLPVYNNFNDWLTNMTHLYKWRLLTAEQKGNYYFAIFDIGMDNSELAFCFRHKSGLDQHLQLKIVGIDGKNLRLKAWGKNASIIQEYQYCNDKGEIIRARELNGYVLRLKTIPRHFRVIASTSNGSHKVIFDQKVDDIQDSVRGIENIATRTLPDTSTLDKWIKVIKTPRWQLLNKTANEHGFFAVFKIDDNTVAFCRQLKKEIGMYDRKSVLKFTDINGKPLKLQFALVRRLNRRYRVKKIVDKTVQETKYSVIDGAKYRTKSKLPSKFRIQYILRADNQKDKIFYNEIINFNK